MTAPAWQSTPPEPGRVEVLIRDVDRTIVVEVDHVEAGATLPRVVGRVGSGADLVLPWRPEYRWRPACDTCDGSGMVPSPPAAGPDGGTGHVCLCGRAG